MNSSLRTACAAIMLLFVGLAPLPTQAAMAPAGVASTADQASALPTAEVRWGRGGGRGFRSGFHRGGRGFHRGFHGGGRGFHRGWHRPRAHFRPYRARPVYFGRPAYYGHGPRCIRRGWVWNGWNYVWRRYRVC